MQVSTRLRFSVPSETRFSPPFKSVPSQLSRQVGTFAACWDACISAGHRFPLGCLLFGLLPRLIPGYHAKMVRALLAGIHAVEEARLFLLRGIAALGFGRVFRLLFLAHLGQCLLV